MTHTACIVHMYMYYEVVNMFIENFLGKVHTIELQVKDTYFDETL